MGAQISIFEPMIVDNFAGGGGASTGIEMATGHPVDIAINHDESAILMHQRNHPFTRHYQDDVWILDPVALTGGRPVHIAWFSPDCKHFSRAKGAALVDKHIRGLAWVAVKWAGLVHPDIIMLENVPEFVTWGPVRKGKPVKSKSGQTFARWKEQLEALGYVIEYRELCAADYGAPTIRTRFLLIARRDGKPIVWPEPTHGPRDSEAVKEGRLKPWRSAAEIIDWTLPCYSIFQSKEEIKEQYGAKVLRPLKDNTLRRIARGVDKFVIRSAEPFVMCNNAQNQPHSIHEPTPTVTTGNRNFVVDAKISPFIAQQKFGNAAQSAENPLTTVTAVGAHEAVTPFLSQYHSEQTQKDVRGQSVNRPVMTVDASNRYGMVAPILTEYYGNGQPLDMKGPLHTVTANDREALTAVHIDKYFAGEYKGCGNGADEPLTTVTALPRQSVVYSHLAHFKGQSTGQDCREPLRTVTQAEGQFAEITTVIVKYDSETNLGYWPQVRELLNRFTDWQFADDEVLLLNLSGGWYFIRDIGLRMLTPRELYNAMGFPPDYIIDRDAAGNPISRKDQVARCGNAVCPPLAAAVVRANCPELCQGEIKNMKELHDIMTA